MIWEELKKQPNIIGLMMAISMRFPHHNMFHYNNGDFSVFYPGDFWIRYYNKRKMYVGQIHDCHFKTYDINAVLFMLEHEGDIIIEQPDNLGELIEMVANK